mmetsp:Transcript_22971/g.58741  ORF Transcript_22971/g.58741 Transcript_22971/m.58741 type:complete len:205 (+) Transcript_22971:679-1293(+)
MTCLRASRASAASPTPTSASPASCCSGRSGGTRRPPARACTASRPTARMRRCCWCRARSLRPRSSPRTRGGSLTRGGPSLCRRPRSCTCGWARSARPRLRWPPSTRRACCPSTSQPAAPRWCCASKARSRRRSSPSWTRPHSRRTKSGKTRAGRPSRATCTGHPRRRLCRWGRPRLCWRQGDPGQGVRGRRMPWTQTGQAVMRR